MIENERVSKIVVCNSVGLYAQALTRGKQYVVLAEDEEKEQIRVKGDNGRLRWFSQYYFVIMGSEVPTLVDWKFDDVIHDSSENSLEHVEITMVLSNDLKRWCSICTKYGLQDYIDRNMDGNQFLIQNQIIVKNFSHDVVNDALKYLDQQDELICSTKSL